MKLRVTVNGNVYDVEVEIEDAGGMALPATSAAPRAAAPAPVRAAAPAPAAAPAAPAPAAGGGAGMFPAPIAGTVRGINCKVGDSLTNNQEYMILEAMKMETSVSAPRAAKVKAILVNVGDAVQAGQALIEVE